MGDRRPLLVSNLAIAPLFVLGPFVAEESLGGATAWGLIGTAGGIGAVLGDAAALRLRPRRPLLAGGLAASLWALEPALLARPFPTAVIAVAAALGFGGSGFSNALWFTALQERIPRQALSRVSSYDWLGSIAFQPAGFALAGPLAAAIGVPATLLGSAARSGRRPASRSSLVAERPPASALVSDSLASAWGAISAWSWSAPPKGGDRHDAGCRKAAAARGPDRQRRKRDTKSPRGLFVCLGRRELEQHARARFARDDVSLLLEELDRLLHRLHRPRSGGRRAAAPRLGRAAPSPGGSGHQSSPPARVASPTSSSASTSLPCRAKSFARSVRQRICVRTSSGAPSSSARCPSARLRRSRPSQ